MLLALKLLVVVGVLSYALAAVLSERELVVHGHHPYPGAAGKGRPPSAFQHPLSHWVRRPRQPGPHHGFGQPAGGEAPQGNDELLGRRVRGGGRVACAVCPVEQPP